MISVSMFSAFNMAQHLYKKHSLTPLCKHIQHMRVYRTNTLFASFTKPYRKSGCEPWIAPRPKVLDRFLDYVFEGYSPIQPQQVFRLSCH